MDNVLKAIIIADAHIGADKFDTHPDRWDAPVREAFNYAVESKADLVISCGDFMHKRNPTVAELLRRRELLAILEAAVIPFVEVDGNHDRPNAEGSHSALEIDSDAHLFQGELSVDWFKKINLIGLPWPHPGHYLNDEAMKLPIDEKINITRNIILNRITDIMGRPTEYPVILFGHAMLAYGPNHTDPKDPGLILGKDVVLPYQAFIDAGLTENQIFMGHVHDPAARGYVGSTQPTDWGDAGHDKSFTELVIGKCVGIASEFEDHGHFGDSTCNNSWVYTVTRHSYADQLQLQDIVLDNVAPGVAYDDVIRQQLVQSPIDIVRITVNLVDDGKADEAVIREIFEARPNYGRVDRVIINHPEREAARVVTETPLADMDAGDAFETWMKQSGFTAEQARGPIGIFQELVESSK